MARYKNAFEPKDVVKNWMRNRSTIEFLGIWEQINNSNFKGVEFDAFKAESGSNGLFGESRIAECRIYPSRIDSGRQAFET